MLYLRCFGELTLECDGQELTGAPARPRTLSLLALVAAHGSQGITRDKVLAYLWPESDTERGRNNLKQALFSIRRSLDRRLVTSSRATLRLDSSVINVDVWQFQEALARGSPAEAVTHYRGPFLDGFYATGLGEFNWWVEAERERLARLHSTALHTLAETAKVDGNTPAAVAWCRALVAAEPLNSQNALALMQALVAAGDSIAALDHARQHAARVEVELGTPPSEAVVEYVRTLRSTLPAPQLPPVAPAVTPPAPLPHALGGGDYPRRRATDSDSRTAVAALPAAGATPRRVEVSSLRLILGLLLAIGLLLLVTLSWPDGFSRETPAGDEATVLVIPFSVTGDEVQDLGAGLSDLIAARLDGAEGLRRTYLPSSAQSAASEIAPTAPSVASSMARKAGARYYVVGRLIASGAGLQASATLHDRANANVEVARAEAGVESLALFDLADAIAAQLIAGAYKGPYQRLTRVAVSSTRSLTALRAYLMGERHLREDRFTPAVDAFRLAVMADTQFALAYYRLSLAADWDGRTDLALSGAESAARFGERLSERDRRLVETYLVRRRGRLDEAERRYSAIVADYPEDSEAWSQLAELLFHTNPSRGRSVMEAGPAFERVLELETSDADALVHLARLRALEGRSGEADSLVRRAAQSGSDSATLDLRALRAYAVGDRVEQYPLIRTLLTTQGLIPAGTLIRVAMQRDDVAGVHRIASLLARKDVPCPGRGIGQRMLAQSALTRGRPDSAWSFLRAEPCDTLTALELRAIYATLPFLRPDAARLADRRAELQAFRSSALGPIGEDTTSGVDEAARRYAIGLASLQLGDTAAARRAAIELARSKVDAAAPLSQSLRARLLLARGSKAQALAVLESARWAGARVYSIAETNDRFLRAQLLQERGRDAEALEWYRTMAQRASHEAVYRAAAEFAQAQIEDRRGNQVPAFAHYRRFREMWPQPAPEVAWMAAEADRRIAALTSARRGTLPDPELQKASWATVTPPETTRSLAGTGRPPAPGARDVPAAAAPGPAR
jgi:DNA-binding SARP family transcriptional activator/tetratricopeptide (TPR) repeat protein